MSARARSRFATRLATFALLSMPLVVPPAEAATAVATAVAGVATADVVTVIAGQGWFGGPDPTTDGQGWFGHPDGGPDEPPLCYDGQGWFVECP